jgi:hypothetical protein
MKEVGAAVCQANETNNPNITGTPGSERNSHIPSLLAQDDSCKIMVISA